MVTSVSNKGQKAYQYQTDVETIKQKTSAGVKSETLSLPSKTNQRDVLEISTNNKFDYYFNDYDGYGNLKEFGDYLRYRFTHTIGHNATWVLGEVGNDLHNMKEQKGAYNGSDMLNSYGYTYVRLYADIEEKYENGDKLWFDRTGKPLTKEEAKEKEIEELNKGYEMAVEWAASCARVMADLQRMQWNSVSEPAQNHEKTTQEVPETQKKDLEDMKRAFYEARNRYMELYKECKKTGEPLTRQDYIFGHNALLSFLSKTWSEYKHE